MHKEEESGAIVGGSPGVQELREGLFTTTSYALKGVDRFIQKRAVLCAVQGFPASPKQRKGKNQKTDSWALILPTHKCPDAINWQTNHMGRKGQATEDTKETILFQNVMF